MSSNPFENDAGGSLNQPVQFSVGDSESNKTQNHDRYVSPQKYEEKPISFDAIAKRLLEENFILTSLELHTELLESGRELRRLRDYFSNPGNFESQGPPAGELARTSSVQTFDSLDFTRYSDETEKEGSDRVAVLEFELRKAKETIKNLREQLTFVSEQTATTNPGGSEPGESPMGHQDPPAAPVLPHEGRAINFLIHEYLLMHQFKLTSVTFSDEVADQDFEDWDEVGVNIPRPANLLSLYRQFLRASPGFLQTRDFSSHVDMEAETNPFNQDEDDFDISADTSQLLNRLNAENKDLMSKNDRLSAEVEETKTEVEELSRKLRIIEENPGSHIPSQGRSGISISIKSESSDAHIERKKIVPQQYSDALFKLTHHKPAPPDLRLLGEIESVSQSSEELVWVVGRSLPHIIPNVILNKREELIPILISTIYLHPESSVRDKLIGWLFNLVKKPEEEQRLVILSGCVALTRRVGPTRAEAEVLPQCWEQMSHKHPERRILVAETCSAVAPFLPPTLLSSLVLSMLQQMLAEDKSELVRAAVVRALAVLCVYIEDTDKFPQMSDLVQRTLMDAGEVVIGDAKRVLIPSFGLYAQQAGQLQTGLFELFIHKILQIVSKKGVNQVANESIICTFMSCLTSLLPRLFWGVVESCPPGAESPSAHPLPNSPSFDYSSRFPPEENPLQSMIVISSDKDILCRLTERYDRITAQEWYPSWDSLDFVSKKMVPDIILMLDRMEVGLSRAIPVCVQFFRLLALYFGPRFTQSKVKPLFQSSLSRTGPESSDAPNAYAAINRATLPVFCTGVLATAPEEENWPEVRRYLRELMNNFGASGADPASLVVTVQQLSKKWREEEEVLDVIREFIPHPTASHRKLTATILSTLVPQLRLSLLRDKILPGLVTLSSDSDSSVKVSAISGLGSVIQVAVTEENIIDKVRLQLSSLFEETEPAVLIPLVRVMAQVAPSLDATFRDEFVLPQLAVMSMKNTTGAFGEEYRASVGRALFDAFSALSCCFLSADALAEAFVPGLRSILKDLDPEHGRIAASILRDAESKIPSTAWDKRGSVVPEIAVEEMRSRMVSKFRDFKGKMDQHKETVPNIFRKK